MIFFAVAPIITSVNPDSDITQFIFSLLTVGIFIYYLRWKNSGSPLINTLTVFLVIMYEGIYVVDKFPVIGKAAFLLGGFGFGIAFFIRIRMKTDEEREGRYSLLKAICVLLYLAGEFIYVMNYPKLSEAAIIGGLALAFGYFYDRFMNYDEIVKKSGNN